MSSFYSDMIYEKILEAGNEAVFIATDFLDIADYEIARKVLNRLDSYGKIKKIYLKQLRKIVSQVQRTSR